MSQWVVMRPWLACKRYGHKTTDELAELGLRQIVSYSSDLKRRITQLVHVASGATATYDWPIHGAATSAQRQRKMKAFEKLSPLQQRRACTSSVPLPVCGTSAASIRACGTRANASASSATALDVVSTFKYGGFASGSAAARAQ